LPATASTRNLREDKALLYKKKDLKPKNDFFYEKTHANVYLILMQKPSFLILNKELYEKEKR